MLQGFYVWLLNLRRDKKGTVLFKILYSFIEF
nr:MAG TPA: hypothetical protein [Caudoviricetes sp.]